MSRIADLVAHVRARPPRLVVRTRHATRVWLWDTFFGFCIAALIGVCVTAAGVSWAWLTWVLLTLTSFRRHVRVDRDGVRITWWWCCFPYRYRRFGPGGVFRVEADDTDDDRVEPRRRVVYDARTVLPEFRWGLTFGRDSIPCLWNAEGVAAELNEARAAHALPRAVVIQTDD